MQQPLRLIIVEDSPADADFIIRVLKSSGLETDPIIIDGEAALRTALSERAWDMVTTDHSMPGFSAPRTLEVVQELQPELPVIIVSDIIDIDLVVSLMKSGARDYIRKENLAQLPLAINRALKEAEIIRENFALAAELQESEEKHRNLVNYSTDPIFTFDRNGNYLFVNEAYARAFAATAREIVGRNMVDMFDPEDHNQRLKSVRAVFDSGCSRQIEVTVPHHDGSTHIYFTQLDPIYDSNGSVVAVAGVSSDITDRKMAEKELEHLRRLLGNIIDSMPSIVVAVDANRLVTQWNAEAASRTGISVEDAAGRPLHEVMPEFTGIMNAMNWDFDDLDIEYKHHTTLLSEGRPRHYNIMLYPLLDDKDDGKAEGAVIRIDDITEHVMLQDLVMQSEKIMSVGGMAAGMAHEINNPLSGMLQAAQNIENRLSLDLKRNREIAEKCNTTIEDIHKYIEMREILDFLAGIRSGGQRIVAIMKNMLQFSRNREPQRFPASLPEIIDRSIELAETDYDFKTGYDFRHIEIVRQYDPDLPEVICSASEIEQVMLNILKNSAQAITVDNTTAARPQIKIKAFREGNAAVVEIEDNGPGMAPDVKGRIFEPFYTTKAPGLGTGLGMSISYHIIVNNHQGQMKVESQPGAGTRIIIRLPFEF